MVGDILNSRGEPSEKLLELWHRDPVDCIEELIGNPAFQHHLDYAPHRVFRDRIGKNQEYSEMNTGTWWWETQVHQYSD
jgi:hypothetical protein